MRLPFTVEQFLAVFERYNRAIWPAQVLAYALALGTLAWVVARPSRAADRSLGLVLAALWVINGAGYHLGFFRDINGMAVAAGGLFLLQAAIFATLALRGRLAFAPRRDGWTAVGLLFVAYAVVLYPLLGLAFGHVYPRSPVFGVAPCPTTIFTFGVLLLASRRVPGWALVVPLLWSFVGGSAAFVLGVREDLFLPLAGVVGTVGVLVRGRRAAASGAATA
jgi:hypothetical protein